MAASSHVKSVLMASKSLGNNELTPLAWITHPYYYTKIEALPHNKGQGEV